MLKILMVAMHGGYADLFDANPDLDLYVLEEEYFYRRNVAGYAAYDITELRLASYQQRPLETVVGEWHDRVGFDAIVPAAEYAVRPAFRAAAHVGLATPGEALVEGCTDKLRMRELAGTTGVLQPRFAPVSRAEDVETFFTGEPVVIKPANRRASVGVVMASRPEDLRDAYARSVGATEPVGVVDRPMDWTYMVEAYVPGHEVSVETIVAEGSVLWHNVTDKQTVGGGSFTEVGHVVPAVLPSDEEATLLSSVDQLLTGLGARAGVFHSEWKLTAQGPVLVECACRPPGDMIPDLVRKVYDLDLYEAYVRSLAGLPVPRPREPRGVASIQYFTPDQGVVSRVDGLNTLIQDTDVFDWDFPLEVGDRVPSFENSWQRAGYYAVHSSSHKELSATTARISGAVRISTSPPLTTTTIGSSS